jgi:hypothetical protein
MLSHGTNTIGVLPNTTGTVSAPALSGIDHRDGYHPDTGNSIISSMVVGMAAMRTRENKALV